MTKYTTPQIAAELGITPRMVQSFLNRGYIQASVQAANGHGSKRIFNSFDLREAVLALFLKESGFTVCKIREMCSDVRKGRYLAVREAVWDIAGEVEEILQP
ncbi:hypothetical protein LCGC14_0728320 [marine sediment metagenome]|uniref:HTH merR-type domain-containing protein n=1 Tax=marine sediment metagenome TaxID=412755 RepID=A0A0F9QVE0_9ZZZZ